MFFLHGTGIPGISDHRIWEPVDFSLANNTDRSSLAAVTEETKSTIPDVSNVR